MDLLSEPLGRWVLGRSLGVRTDLGDTIRALGAVQLDPVRIVAPSHDLVLAARLPRYTPADLEDAIKARSLVEVAAHERCVAPIEDYPIYRPKMLAAHARFARSLDQHHQLARLIRKTIADRGPLDPTDLSETKLSGIDRWGPKTAATLVCDLLWRTGDLVVVERRGARKKYELVENAIPAQYLRADLSNHEARLQRLIRYVRSMGGHPYQRS